MLHERHGLPVGEAVQTLHVGHGIGPQPGADRIPVREALEGFGPDGAPGQEALGAVVVSDNRLGQAEHKRFVEAEINKWGPVIKAAGQYAD